MQDTLDGIQTETVKVYRDKAILVGTFVGGPLAATYLLAENFGALHQRDKASKTWIWGIIATALIFGVIFLIPDTVNIPNQLFPVTYTAIVYYFVQRFQQKNIQAHVSAGGEYHGWGRTIGVALAALAITIIPIVGYVFFSEAQLEDQTSTRVYGDLKHEIAFDRSNLQETEVDNLAEGLTTTAFFDQSATKYVYAKKVNDDYELYIGVIEQAANDNETIESFKQLRADLQRSFPNNTVNFNLVVDNLDNVVKRIE